MSSTPSCAVLGLRTITEPFSMLAGDPHVGEAEPIGQLDGPVGPLDRAGQVVAQHPGLGDRRHRPGPQLVARQLIEQVDERLGRHHGPVGVAQVPRQAGPQLQRPRLLAEVAGGASEAQPPVGVLDPVGQLVGHPRRLGGDGGELEVVVLLGQAQLGESQGLVGGAQLEVAARALAGHVDQLVEPAGAVQVRRDRGQVVAVDVAQGVDGPLVDATPLPSEQAGLDRLLGAARG